jgi:hypothetical protein
MSVIRADNFGPSAGGTTRSLRGIAAAWANLNGTGTIALRDSQNVSSVVDNGTGDYTHNLTNAMTNSNFATSSGERFSAASGVLIDEIWTVSASAIRNQIRNTAGTVGDCEFLTSIAHGDIA